VFSGYLENNDGKVDNNRNISR